MVLCHQCNEKINDSRQYSIRCTNSYCQKWVHQHCAKIPIKLLGSRKTTYVCDKCSAITSLSDTSMAMADRVSSDTAEKILEKLSNLEETFSRKFEDITLKLTAIEDKISGLDVSIKENQALAQQTAQRVEEIEIALESTLIYQRRNNLEINGVPSRESENLYELMSKIANLLNIQLDKKDIDIIHRVPTRLPKPQPIIVRLLNRWKKLEILDQKPRIKTSDLGLPGPSQNIYIGHHLTRNQHILLGKAKQKCLEWGGRDKGAIAGHFHGKIKIKPPGSEQFIVLESVQQLNAIRP